MIKDPGIMMDGQVAISKGMNSGFSPSRLGNDEVSFAINTTFRGDFAAQRPGWIKRTLTFENATVQGRFEDNFFQNAAYYESFTDENDTIVVSVEGRIFMILDDDSVQEITPKDSSGVDDLNTPTQMVWMEQAEEFLLIQNGLDRAIVFDGGGTRRAVPQESEVPTGTIMTYALGRLWVASPARRSFVASDIVYGPTGTAKYQRRDGILKFTENDFLNEGGAFSIPAQFGLIVDMSPIANLDTSLGQGPIQVFTERGSFSINAPFDRETWKDLTSPIQTVSSINYGPKGAVIPVNGDIWFRAEDGLRTFQVARRNFNSWVNAPMSHEMDRVLNADDQSLLRFCSGTVFDNRLLVTCAPQFDGDHGVYHLGLVALNLDNVSSITEPNPPAYDGLWTGIKILKILTGYRQGRQRCFMLALNSADKIELWEMSTDQPYDDTDKLVQWVIETPSFRFGRPGDLKSFEGADLWIDQVYGPVTVTFKYRPDQYPGWQDWHSYTACAQMENCATAECNTMYDLKRQHRTRIMAPKPADDCESTNNVNMRFGYEFQARLEFLGPARVMKFRVRSRTEPELPGGCS